MQIFIRGLTDRTHIFEVFPSDTVARVKKQVHQRLGVPPIHLRLMFNGRQLDSNKTLSDHNVDKESTLEGAIRLRGGKPVILLYPPSPLDASVHLSLNFGWKFSTLYPAPSREKVGPYDHAPVSTIAISWVMLLIVCLGQCRIFYIIYYSTVNVRGNILVVDCPP